MAGYYRRRLQALLDSPVRIPVPTVKPDPTDDAGPHKRRPQRSFRCSLDNETIAWLERKAPKRHRLRFLNALAYANPTLDCWQDTRSDDLKLATFNQLRRGVFPLWTEGTEVVSHRQNLPLDDDALAIYCMVSDNYGIVPQQYTVMFGKYEGIRSPSLNADISPQRRLSGVLRAIGGGYLTPQHDPHLSYVPKRKPRPNRNENERLRKRR